MPAPSSDADEALIFAQALQLPASERDAYLRAACGQDNELLSRLEALLRVQDRVGDFMEPPAMSEAASFVSLSDPLPTQIGPYTLLEKIGEGGCGVIYRAQQERPVRREVALKIIKPGMDTREVIARFEAERQALALMDHPGIAKVFDAGETEAGRPYFVMELIRGTKITTYCDEQALSTEERLKLFVQVCQAIQHAHQKGVIHRDIKPSNILVTTTSEGTLQPVVIDFGIAKATANVHLTDKTLFTAVNLLVGTPTYMSPEQTALSSADVDTRSDIYGLGVLLYELLTGTTPFDAGDLLQRGIDEVRRAIREIEPPRPSTRLSGMTGKDLTAIAQRRQSEPPNLIRALRGDLDWVAMKSLEKDRSRRYETASAFAADIQHYLASEPVSARPASLSYRLQKTMRRHRVFFAALSVVAALLVGSLIAISLALQRERQSRQAAEIAQHAADAARAHAEREQARAVAQAEKSRQVTRFLNDALRGVSPQVSQGRDTAVLREVMEKISTRIETELRNQPGVRGEIYGTISRIYRDMMLWPQAAEASRRAIAAYDEERGPGSDEAATNLIWLGSALHTLRQSDESAKTLREALEIKRRVHGEEHLDVALAMNQLGVVLYQSGKSQAEAETFVRRALAIREKLLPPGHMEIAASSYYLAGFVANRDDRQAEAERLYQQALDLWIRERGPEGFNIDIVLATLGIAQRNQGKLALAQANSRRALEISRKKLDSKHPIIPYTLFGLAVGELRQGKLDEAERSFRAFMAFGGPAEGTQNDFLRADTFGYLFQIQVARGDWASAETLAREEFPLALKLRGREHSQTAWAIGHLATALAATGRVAEADRVFDEHVTPELLAGSAGPRFRQERASYRARLGRWPEALIDAKASIHDRLEQLDAYHALAALLVQERDVAGYRTLTRQLIGSFATTDTAVMAMRLAMDCLVLPPAKEDIEQLARWVDLGTQDGIEGTWTNYGQCAKALLEYRRENFSEASKWAALAQASLRPDVRAMAGATEAMARARQGDRVAARSLLEKYEAFSELPANAADLGGEWKEWIHADLGREWKATVLARALLGEAQEVIAEHASRR